MIQIRRAEERGTTEVEWLKSSHTFSFNYYLDRRFMGFRALRVINEDWIAPARGFPTHGHRDMEIITYVLEGAVEHRDSLGNGSVIRVGEIQRMSAGTGITHSESNPSPSEPLHLLQIWIVPAERGIAPGYEQRLLDRDAARGKFAMLAGPDGDGHSVRIHQDASLWMAILEAGQSAERGIEPERHAWIQIARGQVTLGGHQLGPGDGAGLSGEPGIHLTAQSSAEVLLFDLA